MLYILGTLSFLPSLASLNSSCILIAIIPVCSMASYHESTGEYEYRPPADEPEEEEYSYKP